ncbi:hypothetical protein OPQ81_002886 [Rhizoctonia solani]|nr:hypothetical protein OPQ81_002886 [Rhizoctonia solani]
MLLRSRQFCSLISGERTFGFGILFRWLLVSLSFLLLSHNIMRHYFDRNVAASWKTEGQTSGHNVSADSSLPVTPAPTARSPLPSRIPRPIHNSYSSISETDDALRYSSMDRNARRQGGGLTAPTSLSNNFSIRQKGYLAPTFASSQRQRERRIPSSKFLVQMNTVNKTSLDTSTEQTMKERIVSKIPVLSRTRPKTPSPESPPSTRASLSPPSRVPTSARIPNSPPPEYTERPVASRQSPTTSSPPSPPDSPPQSSPVYHEHASELEYELYICPYPPGDSESEATTLPLGSLSNVRPKLPFIALRRIPHASKLQLDFTCRGEGAKLLKSWLGKTVPRPIERLDDEPDLDDLSRAILQDIFSVLDSIPSTQAIALYAYFNH